MCYNVRLHLLSYVVLRTAPRNKVDAQGAEVTCSGSYRRSAADGVCGLEGTVQQGEGWVEEVRVMHSDSESTCGGWGRGGWQAWLEASLCCQFLLPPLSNATEDKKRSTPGLPSTQ